MKDYARATREPFINVHFGGTESATAWQGYMDGAVESGERVAHEVMYNLYRNDPTVKINYEKTYYYHKELTQKLDEEDFKKQNNKLVKCSKFVLKSGIVVAAAYYLAKRFNLNLKVKIPKLF
jgi:hypothetical protein